MRPGPDFVAGLGGGGIAGEALCALFAAGKEGATGSSGSSSSSLSLKVKVGTSSLGFAGSALGVLSPSWSSASMLTAGEEGFCPSSAEA